jgi:uncharacterized protein (TIGR02594 family)
MVQLFAFRRPLRAVSRLVSRLISRPLSFGIVALALCSAAMVSPASARSHHGIARHAYVHHVSHRFGRHLAYRHYRHVARLSRWDAGVERMREGGFADANASFSPQAAPASMAGNSFSSGGFGSSDVVSEARRYIGGNPTGRGNLWCARFMNMVLQRSGHHGTGSDLASSFARYGQRVSGPQVGAIAVMGRRGGGHVGIITGIDAQGNPIMISGNNGNRVREAPVSRGRIYAYVLPTG